jgi:hypothetical protein
VAVKTLVDTDSVQTLTNKTLISPIITGAILGGGGTLDLGTTTVTGTTAQFNTALTDNNFATLAGSETLTNKTIALGSNTVSGSISDFNSALSGADFATLAGSEALTNKTINLASNTVTGTIAEFNTALTDNDFATIAGTESLTNKTITALAPFIVTADGVTAFSVLDSGGTSVNGLQISAAVAGGSVRLDGIGETNVNVAYVTKGTGQHAFYTGGAGPVQVVISHVANAVNYVQLNGGITTNAAQVRAAGSDTNVSMQYWGQGTGSHDFVVNGNVQVTITNIASAVNLINLAGAATGNGPTIKVTGADTNININITPKGTGVVGTSRLTITDTGENSINGLTIINTNSNGAGIRLLGDGATTPAKWIRVNGGNLQITNNAYTQVTHQFNDDGQMYAHNKIYPGPDEAGAFQTSCGICAGVGAPANGNGNDGDIYFRSDGGAGTTIYQRRAGAWVGIV